MKVGDSELFPAMVKQDHYTGCMEGTAPTRTQGGKGAIMQLIERKIGRKLVWIVCDLHTNELPLRHLIQELDGKTLSHNRWSCPLGKMLDSASELEISLSFERNTVGPPLVELAHTFIVAVYLLDCFNTKVKSSFSKGPRHVLFYLEFLGSQPRKVVQSVEQTARRSSWYAHPEAVLQTMLCSKDEEERRVAVKKIMDMRLTSGSGHDKSVGDDSFRVRETPEINLDAKTLSDLIDLDNIQAGSEPPLTCSLTSVQVRAFLDNLMYVPAFSSHSQSIEHCVQQVSEASSHVYSQEKKEGYIRAQVVSREVMSRNRSKKDMFSVVCSNTGS
ncbi:hypothetical protein O3P69_020037 [Scylla paramamosain]|uniref:Uncharacterized protein n=1 Tax=Scylla paramamosain TaxID=85552 RepID=A0AAW0TJG2_SCYPA